MSDEATPKPEKTTGLSTRGAVLVTLGILGILGAAVCTVALWPEIQLRYHRHYFRKGTPEEQTKAFLWICEHRIRKSMSKEDVERVLGERLEERVALVDIIEAVPRATVYQFFPRLPERVDGAVSVRYRTGVKRSWSGGKIEYVYGGPGLIFVEGKLRSAGEELVYEDNVWPNDAREE